MNPPNRVIQTVDSPSGSIVTVRRLRLMLGALVSLLVLVVAPATSSAAQSPTALSAPANEIAQAEDTTTAGDDSATTGVETDEPDEDAVDPEEEAANQLLRDGQDVFAAVCQSCHQPGGVGLAGQFPPLKGNDDAKDPDYVTSVIIDGKSGPITVNGETFDGVMPSFSTLSDDDVTAVVAFVTNDLVAPAAPNADVSSTGPVAGTQLPGFASTTYFLTLAVAFFVLLLVVGPRLISQNDRLNTPWFDVGLKTVTIVVGFVISTVVIPNWALNTSTVSKLDRPWQDFIGSGLWAGGLGIGLWALWYAHRDSRI